MLNKLSQKLLVVMLIIGLVPALVLSTIFYDLEINRNKNTIEHILTNDAINGAQKNTMLINEIKNNIENVVHDDEYVLAVEALTNNDDIDKFNAVLVLGSEIEQLFENTDGLYELAVIHPDNFEVLYYSGVYSHASKVDKKYLEIAKTESVVSDVFLDEHNNQSPLNVANKSLRFYILVPVFSESGLEGITYVGLDANILDQNVLPVSDFSSIDSYMINTDGFMISKPKFNEKMMDFNLFETRPELELQQTIPNTDSHTRIFEIMKLNYFNQAYGYTNFLGQNTLGSISPIDNTPWFYVVEVEETEAFDELYDLMIIFVSSFIIASLVILETALIFSNSLTAPISNLVTATKKIIEGKMGTKLTHSNIKEISDLSSSFEEMQIHLNESTKQIQQAYSNLELNEQKFRDLYEHSPNLLRTIDVNGIILNCNEMYAQTLGYTKKEIIGSSIFNYVPKENLDEIKKSFEDWKKFGRVKGQEIIMMRKDGTTFPTLITASSINNKKGDLIGSNTSIIDLSEIHQAKKVAQEEKLKRLTAIGELSARIAHDLRNPLSVLKNTVELIQLDLGENQNEKTKDKFKRITRAITRINHQVENVLDFVKEKPLKLEISSINSILDFVIDRINVPPNITINLPKDDLKIMCDFEKLEIVFINLITNAIQVMSNKGKIDIRTKKSGSNCVIEIEDNGPGISNENLEKIFDPLFTTRQIGTGLGLPSCKTIVDAHKGKIEVTSILGKGTVFRIELPQIQDEATLEL